MKGKETVKVGQLSDAEFEAKKKELGSMFEISVLDEKGAEHYGYITSPDRIILGLYQKRLGENPVLAREYLRESCWVCGSEEIEKNMTMSLGFDLTVSSTVGIFAIAELKKK